MMDFDEMLIQVGEFGVYQKALFVFQAPFCIFVTFVLFGQLFMTLHPMQIWCGDHFQCTTGNMTPFQRQNVSFGYTAGALNPCFVRKFDSKPGSEMIDQFDIAFVKAIVDWINNDGGTPRNYTEATNASGLNLDRARNELGLEAERGGRRITLGRQRASLDPLNRNVRAYGYGGGAGYRGRDRDWDTTARPNQREEYVMVTERGKTTTFNYGGRGPPTTTEDESEFGSETETEINGGRPGGWAGPTPRTERPSTGGGGLRPFDGGLRPSQGSGSSTGAQTDQSRQQRICTHFVNIQIANTTGIFMREFVPGQVNSTGRVGGATSTGGLKPPGPKQGSSRSRNSSFIPVERCRNVSWDRRLAGVPYNTIVTDGGWWCNAEAYTTASQVVFFLGAIVGGFLIGWIADNYGRVPALVIANLFGAIGGALSVSTTNFWLFSFYRFITGMAFDNCFTMMYILVLEFCGPTYRTLVANLSIAIFYTVGTLILPGLALLVNNWQIYGLIISLPMLLGLLAIFLVPESARWLLSKGRTKEATNILRSFAKVNGKQVDDQVFVDFENDAQKLFDEMADEEEQSFTQALKTPRLRKTFMLLVAIWSIIAFVYDGHSRNILNLADQNWNVFYMFAIASMTEFPADVLLIFTLDLFGRRWLSFGALTMSGAASIIAATIPQDMRTVGLVMAIIARFFVNVAFNIGLQFAAELLPTVIRAQGVNAIHIMGYVASIISPFIASLGRTNPALSLILLGSVSIVGGCLSLFLSETLGEDLPNTLEEAEAFGKDQSFWNCPICSKPKDDEGPDAIQEEDSMVTRRNKFRSSMSGAIYRSSIISHSSRGSNRVMISPQIRLNPNSAPNENTPLRRITH